MTELSLLPPELHSLIASFLPLRQFQSLKLLSRYWCELIRTEEEHLLTDLPLWISCSHNGAAIHLGAFQDNAMIALRSASTIPPSAWRFTLSLPLLQALRKGLSKNGAGQKFCVQLSSFCLAEVRDEDGDYKVLWVPYALLFPSPIPGHSFWQGENYGVCGKFSVADNVLRTHDYFSQKWENTTLNFLAPSCPVQEIRSRVSHLSFLSSYYVDEEKIVCNSPSVLELNRALAAYDPSFMVIEGGAALLDFVLALPQPVKIVLMMEKEALSYELRGDYFTSRLCEWDVIVDCLTGGNSQLRFSDSCLRDRFIDQPYGIRSTCSRPLLFAIGERLVELWGNRREMVERIVRYRGNSQSPQESPVIEETQLSEALPVTEEVVKFD